MSCVHCDATYQRGRFCNRCGKLMPPTSHVERRTPLIRRRTRDGDAHQPVGRGRDVAPAARASHQDDLAATPAMVRRMYDTALERAAVHSRPSLQRYLAVLVTP
jgi:hypothetical protein